MQNSPANARTIQSSALSHAIGCLFNRRMFRGLLFGSVCLVTLIALLYAEEDWRGKRAWENFKREWEARGEKFEVTSFIPKPVPAEQNFAMTPFLAPLLDYQYAGQPRTAIWRDSNALARAQGIKHLPEVAGKNFPSFDNWAIGAFIDLSELQTLYRASTNFPSTPRPQGPARDVLFALSKYDSIFEELHHASSLPYSVFPVHYDEGSSALLLHLALLKELSEVLRIHAVANLAADQTAEALADIELALHLAASLESEPFLISQLVRNAILQNSLQPVWEGLAKHQWSGEELEELQKALGSIRLLEDYRRSLRAERSLSNDLADKLRAGGLFEQDLLRLAGASDQLVTLLTKFAPRGWIYQNQLLLNRLYQERGLPVIDAANHRVYVGLCKAAAVTPELASPTVFNRVGQLLFPAVANIAPKFARGQTAIDLATLACALERYRIAQDQHPDKLESLVPRFIERIPSDVITGEPLKYRRTYDGQFVLYSVGWNEKDDRGEIALSKSKSSVDYDAGDCVWRPCGWAGTSEGIKLAGQ